MTRAVDQVGSRPASVHPHLGVTLLDGELQGGPPAASDGRVVRLLGVEVDAGRQETAARTLPVVVWYGASAWAAVTILMAVDSVVGSVDVVAKDECVAAPVGKRRFQKTGRHRLFSMRQIRIESHEGVVRTARRNVERSFRPQYGPRRPVMMAFVCWNAGHVRLTVGPASSQHRPHGLHGLDSVVNRIQHRRHVHKDGVFERISVTERRPVFRRP